ARRSSPPAHSTRTRAASVETRSVLGNPMDSMYTHQSKPCQEVAQSEDGSPTSSAPRWRSSRGTLRGFWAASMRATRRTCPPLKETRVRSTLIDDLRTLALAGSGTLALHRESVDVGALLQDLVAAFGARAEAAGVALTTECPADLTTVEVDSVRIRQ